MKRVWWCNSLLQKLNNGRRMVYKRLPVLSGVTVEVTRRCNLHCRHCYLTAAQGEGEDLLATAEMLALIDRLYAAFGRRVTLTFTGGEPLLRPDLTLIASRARHKGISAALVTNGLLLRSISAADLRNFAAVSISIDGLCTSHNYLRGAPVFADTCDAARLVKRCRVNQLIIKTAVYPRNLDELCELHRLVLDLEADVWHIFPVEPRGRAATDSSLLMSKQQYRALCRRAAEFAIAGGPKIIFGEQPLDRRVRDVRSAACSKQCLAGIRSMGVCHNGDIVPCIGGKREGKPAQGNAKTSQLREVWEKGFAISRSPGYRGCGNHYYEQLTTEEG